MGQRESPYPSARRYPDRSGLGYEGYDNGVAIWLGVCLARCPLRPTSSCPPVLPAQAVEPQRNSVRRRVHKVGTTSVRASTGSGLPSAGATAWPDDYPFVCEPTDCTLLEPPRMPGAPRTDALAGRAELGSQADPPLPPVT